MTYPETLAYLYDQLPMFQRVGPPALKKDLTNILSLMEGLDNPHKEFKSIHIAGTNGKGSVAHMLAAILQSAGYKTGLYTSPHLKTFRERIRLNGEPISEEDVVNFVEKNSELFGEIKPSFFEVTVAMAFDYFSRQKVDVAVIEVGLGGRLDSTNVLERPEISVITNIGYDHQNFLGETLPEIAGEKAGIIKEFVPVIIGEQRPETMQVFLNAAKRKHAPVYFAPIHYRFEQVEAHEFNQVVRNLTNNEEYTLDLLGSYQLKNLPAVFNVIDVLRERDWKINDAALRTGLARSVLLTGLQGRWQKHQTHPWVISDIAHNSGGVGDVMEQLTNIPYRKLHIVWGMVNDKDPRPIMELLPRDASYYFCTPDIPRGMDIRDLKSLADEFQLRGNTHDSVSDAYEIAYRNAGENDLIFIGGSTFVVAEFMGMENEHIT